MALCVIVDMFSMSLFCDYFDCVVVVVGVSMVYLRGFGG